MKKPQKVPKTTLVVASSVMHQLANQVTDFFI